MWKKKGKQAKRTVWANYFERRNNRGHATHIFLIKLSISFFLAKQISTSGNSGFKHQTISQIFVLPKRKNNKKIKNQKIELLMKTFFLYVLYVPIWLIGERTRDMTKWCQMEAHLVKNATLYLSSPIQKGSLSKKISNTKGIFLNLVNVLKLFNSIYSLLASLYA